MVVVVAVIVVVVVVVVGVVVDILKKFYEYTSCEQHWSLWLSFLENG